MDTKRDRQISSALDAAEAQGLWVIPDNHAQDVALRNRVAKGELVMPIPGCFARMETFGQMKVRQRSYVTLKTLAALHPGWVFCSFSAAVLHGLWVSNSLLKDIHIVNPGEYGRAGKRVIRHEGQLDKGDIKVYRGIRLTSLERTLMDCLCHTTFRQGLPILDSALHWGLTDDASIARYFAERGYGRRGIRQARTTLRHADGRSGSALESLARAVMIELGFQVPELQVELFDPLEPDNPKFGDFGWCLQSPRPIIGEADGAEKYLGKDALRGGSLARAVRSLSRERRRESHINLTDAKVIRFSYRDVFDTSYFERLLTAAGVPRASTSC